MPPSRPTRPPRRAITTPGSRRDPSRRTPGGIAVSVLVHVVAVLAILRLVNVVPTGWLFTLREPPTPAAERVTFLAFPPTQAGRTRPRDGGDNRAPGRTPEPAQIIAPAVVPSAIPDAPKAAPAPPAGPAGGAGAVVGGGGPAQGLRPLFADPRLWIPPAPPVGLPLTRTQKLDSAIASLVQTLEDSLSRLPRERAPGDWTYSRNGKKYGIDGSLIHLGNFSLPTALLALLPMNATANPSGVERDRRLTAIRGEIQYQAARAARDDDFYRAVKALRERKEKERAEQKKAVGEPPVPVVTKP